MNRKTFLTQKEQQRAKGKMFYFSLNKHLTTDINEKIKSFLEVPTIYKLFYEFKDIDNPNKGFKCIFDDFFKLASYTSELSERYLTDTIKSIKYIFNTTSNPISFKLDSDHEYKVRKNTYQLYDFIEYINKKIPDIDLKEKLNNFYISGNKKTLYIIEDQCLGLFNIQNKIILTILNKLPIISSTTDMITLNYNILNPNSKITKTKNTNNYKSSNDIQIFKFNGNDLSIINNLKNKATEFTLDGNIEDWYYINTLLDDGTNITQLIYITLEDSKKFNEYFLRYKTSFKFDLHRIYKVLYENNDDRNSNRGFKCIYKDIFKSGTIRNFQFEKFSEKSKIIKICYCKAGNKPEILHSLCVKNWFYDKNNYLEYFFKDFLKSFLHIDILTTFDYNKLYISEDETILYYIENDYINTFNVLNRIVLNNLDKMPNIEYSKEISTKNNSDYYTITLNNNLFGEKIKKYLSYISPNNESGIYNCSYDIQLFKFNNDQINKIEIQANTTFSLDGDIRNWYYILTTLKNPAPPSRGEFLRRLKINSITNGENILQLIYISPDIIELYKQMFIELKMPIDFEIKSKIKSSRSPQFPSPNYPSIKVSTGGDYKSTRLLKSY